MKVILFSKLLFLLFFIYSINTLGQNCGCNYTIPTNKLYINNDSLGAKPGDVVCISAGTRNYLGLKNFHGAPGNPIIFKNCGGQAVIGNSGWYYGMRMDNCTHFLVTGSGDPSTIYGFKINNTPAGTMGLIIDAFSTDFEVERFDISGTGFAGIMAKTDPDCTGKPNRGNFIMKNVSIHDNYIHETGGEGMYIGFPHYSGIIRLCGPDSVKTLEFPHDIVGLRIYNNIIESTTREGIQVGCATSDFKIYNNLITNFGTGNQKYNNSGVHFATGTVCEMYSNVIRGGSGPGIWLNGMGDDFIFNNLITDMGGEGVMIHDSIVAPGKGFHIINNTFVNGKDVGINLYNNFGSPILTVSNNIFANMAGFYNINSSQFTYANNLFSKAIKGFHFQNPDGGDYHLKAVSPAVDGGYDMAYMGIVTDLEYNMRPRAKAYDVGAFESPFERVYDEFTVNPNPIHAQAHITVVLLDDSEGSIKVYDVYGREVATIASGFFESGKKYEFDFDSLYLAHGIYLYVLRAGDVQKVLKVLKVE